MEFQLTALPAFADNYIWLLTDASGNAAVVDPGDAAPVEQALAARRLKLRAVLVTHHHADHMGGAAVLARHHGCQVYGPAREAADAVDLPLAEGAAVELPGLGGKVVTLGRELGVPTPPHGMMYALLKPYIMGTPS